MLTILAVALMGMAATGTASAQSSISAVNCNHYSGGGILPRSANYVRDQGDGAATGAAQLCRSGSTYWGYAVFYAPMPSTSWGQAYLIKYHNGVRVATYDCDTAPQGPPSGGNGWIRPGQTQCWTAKFSAPSTSDTFQACGYAYFGRHPDKSFPDSWGCTARVR